MATKKTQSPKDRHKSGFLVRLPEEYRLKIAELRTKTRRPITVEVQIALDAHLESNGVAKPVTST